MGQHATTEYLIPKGAVDRVWNALPEDRQKGEIPTRWAIKSALARQCIATHVHPEEVTGEKLAFWAWMYYQSPEGTGYGGKRSPKDALGLFGRGVEGEHPSVWFSEDRDYLQAKRERYEKRYIERWVQRMTAKWREEKGHPHA
jgi:hypothetical protein